MLSRLTGQHQQAMLYTSSRGDWRNRALSTVGLWHALRENVSKSDPDFADFTIGEQSRDDIC